MPPILQQKALVIPLISILIGAFFHWRGRHLTTDENATLKQGVGLAFDLFSSNFTWLYLKHQQNKAAIQQNVQTLENHAEALSTVVGDKSAISSPPVNGGKP